MSSVQAWRRHFPLQTVPQVVSLLRAHLSSQSPNLAFLSIVLGCVEHSLTRPLHELVPKPPASPLPPGLTIPTVQWSEVMSLYSEFTSLLSSCRRDPRPTDRPFIKKVSDVIWARLNRNYKERYHLQTLYSYLTANKLDCFGVAFAVVAACQLLGVNDVHLSLSEDHAWVMFGTDGTETAEVTWHGKAYEDKRGQPITVGIEERSWIYLNNQPVQCTRHMEVAAMVVAINSNISGNKDSYELSVLQQELLWLLYDLGHLEKYPTALSTLADLEAITPTQGRPPCLELFNAAIHSVRHHYSNHHVYPYTYLGSYLYRKKQYKGALRAWADAGDAIRNYNYNREDEEIYKEFMEIATELIPMTMKHLAGEGDFVTDPECFAYFVRFCDCLCHWEEGSVTPVLHIGWAKPLVQTFSKFNAQVRSRVKLLDGSQNEDGENVKEKTEPVSNNSSPEVAVNGNHDSTEKPATEVTAAADIPTKATTKSHTENGSCSSEDMEVSRVLAKSEAERERREKLRRSIDAGRECEAWRLSPPASPPSPAAATADFIRSLETNIHPTLSQPNPNIAALAKGCGDNILNRDYLLDRACHQPFSITDNRNITTLTVDTGDVVAQLPSSMATPSASDCPPLIQPSPSANSPITETDETPKRSPKIKKDGKKRETELNNNDSHFDLSAEKVAKSVKCGLREREKSHDGDITVMLWSEKMRVLRELFQAEKLNPSAITLQLTAQSQVHMSKRTPSRKRTQGEYTTAYITTAGGKRSKRD